MNDWKEIDFWHQRDRDARAAADAAIDEPTKLAHLKEADDCSARAWALLNNIKRRL